MARILVLNNYSLERVWQEVREGDKPDHHLYGLNHFADAGHEITIAPFRKSSAWLKGQGILGCIHFPIPLGNLDQQAFALRYRRQADLIYAPCQTDTQMLGYLRRFGLKRPPMVCLAHHPFETGRLAALRRPFVRANLLGTSRYPSLSQKVADEINSLANHRLSEAVPWGPQKDYYEIATGTGSGAVAAGRTGRDFDTLGRAATQSGSSARIICLESAITPNFSRFGQSVRVETHPDHRPLGYRALMQAFSAARVLAIPMLAGNSMAGLTSLTDALGVGIPVIITRNPYIDLDVEALGIGRWVEPGDVRGWADALRWFDTHPDEAAEMGRRARSLVDGGLNSESFARRMMELFEHVLKQDPVECL